MAIFRREPPNGGVECWWSRQKSQSPISIWPVAVNAATDQVLSTSAAGPSQVVTLIAGTKRRSLLMAGDDDEMFMTRSFNVTPKKTE